MKGTPKGIKASLESDGSLLIQILLENGDIVDVSFNQADAQHFVQVAQQAMLERATKTTENFGVALVRLQGSGAGTGVSGPSVQVSMEQIGLVSLIASDAQLLKLKDDIERALEMRSEKKRSN
jgi:hypothetical protein